MRSLALVLIASALASLHHRAAAAADPQRPTPKPICRSCSPARSPASR